MTSRFCQHCGERLSPDARFCPGCGTKIDTPHESAVVILAKEPAARTSRPSRGAWIRAAVYLTAACVIAACVLAVASTHKPKPTAFPGGLAKIAHTNSVSRTTDALAAKRVAACHSAIDPLMESLTNLNSDLGVGLTFSAYSTEVAHANRGDTYAGAHIGGAGTVCISKIGRPLEAALNDYIKASNTWNQCITDFLSCSNDSIKPTLQADWAKARSKIQAAQLNLQFLHDLVTANILLGGAT